MKLTYVTLTITLLYHLVPVYNHIVSSLQQALVLDGLFKKTKKTHTWRLVVKSLKTLNWSSPISPAPFSMTLTYSNWVSFLMKHTTFYICLLFLFLSTPKYIFKLDSVHFLHINTLLGIDEKAKGIYWDKHKLGIFFLNQTELNFNFNASFVT